MRFLLSNKVATLLVNTADFFFVYGERKLLFQPFEVGWLSPKLAANSWRCQNSLVTSLVVSFRVIMGDENRPVQNADCRPGTKCRLQTADRVQNADCTVDSD